MKKSIKNGITLLAAITVGSFLLFGASFLQPLTSTVKSKPNIQPEARPWICPDKVNKLSSPVKPEEGILSTGKEIWMTQCKSCHGKTGKGDGVKATKIDIPIADFTSDKCQQATDGELFWKATEGRKPMPSYKDKLSDIERWCVVLYIRTLAEN